MTRSLGLAKVPTLDPKGEQEYPSYEYVRALVRAINSNFEIINGSYRSTGDQLAAGSEDLSGISSLTATVTPPGNTMGVGRSKKIGPMVDLVATFNFTSGGNGEYRFVLPYPHLDLGAFYLMINGVAKCYDASAGTEVACFPQLVFDNKNHVRFITASGAVVTNAAPFAWDNGDVFEVAMRYEAAQ